MALTEQGKPDLAYILEVQSYLRERFSAQKTLITQMRELRRRTHNLNVPDIYMKSAHQVHTPLLGDMEQRIVATLTANEPTWEATPLGERRKDQEAATILERWLVAAHKRMDQEAGRAVLTDALSAAVGDGMGVLQYRYRPYTYPYLRRRKEEEPQDYVDRVNDRYRAAPFPFTWRSIDPLSYYFHEPDEGVNEVLIVERKPVKPTLRKLGLRYESGQLVPGEMGRSISWADAGSETAEVIEHWTTDWVSWTIDGKLAKQMKHGWGKTPFFHFAGLTSHENTPERTFLPVCWAFKDLIPLLDRLMTMKANWMYLSAFPQPVLQMLGDRLSLMTSPGRPTEPVPEIRLGELLVLHQDEKFSLVPPPAVGADLNQMLQLIMDMIQNAGLGNVMRGAAPTGDASGYLVNQLMTAGLLTYKPIIAHGEAAYAQGGQFLLWLIENQVRREVPVWATVDGEPKSAWLELGPQHIRGFYQAVYPKLDPMLPTNEIMLGRFGLESWKAGGISWETYIEDYMKRNPDEEEDRRLIEKAKLLVEEKLIYEAGVRAGILSPIAPQEPAALGAGPESNPLGVMGATGMPGMPGAGLPVIPPPPTQLGPNPLPNVGGQFGVQSEVPGPPMAS